MNHTSRITTSTHIIPVAQHFGINVNNAKDYNIIILDQDSVKNRRLRLEEAWIYILETMTPRGLNTKW